MGFMREKLLKKLVFYLLTFWAVAFVLIGIPGAIQAREADPLPQTLEELQQQIKAIMREYSIPGVSLAMVSKDNFIWIGGIGTSDIATGKAATGHTIFRWGSVSKSFIAVAVQMLTERRLLDLEAKIRDLAPEIAFENPWESSHPVKLVHCLEHTTGFDDMHFKELAVDDATIGLSDGLSINPNPRHSRWRPGTFMAYNNIAPSIAAYILEKVTRQSFETFVQENIFNPLGMGTASFFYPEQKDLMSKGYAEDGLTEVKYDYIFLRPSGSLNASAQDMAQFIRMLLNRGMHQSQEILKPESIRRMEIPTTTLAAQAGSPYGYGLGNFASIKHGVVFQGHGGGIPGFAAYYGYNTDAGIGYALSVNAPNSGWDKLDDLISAYLTIGRGIPSPMGIKLSEEQRQSSIGFYQGITPGNALSQVLLLRFLNTRHIYFKDGKLFSRNFLGGPQRELIPVSKGLFYRKAMPDIRLFFFKSGAADYLEYADMRGSYQKVSVFQAYFPVVLAIFVLCLMITSPLFALLWIPRKIFGCMKGVLYLRARIFPMLAVLCFLVTFILLVQATLTMEMDEELMADLGKLSVRSFSIFLAGICFAIFSLLGLWFSIRAFSIKMNRTAKIHSFLVSMANGIAAIYLAFNGLIGIMTWAY